MLEGCPQGEALSPLLWRLVINSLLRLVNRDDVRANARSNITAGVGACWQAEVLAIKECAKIFSGRVITRRVISIYTVRQPKKRRTVTLFYPG